MSEDPLALYSITSTTPSDPSVLPSESDYEAICAAVMESLRGRWFLAEYARRNRHSDTKVVLSAIERIEAMIRGDSVAPPTDRFRVELADMAKAIARTKSEIAAIKPEAEQPGKILEASEELDSIVHATENATSKILAAAEQIQEIAWTVREQDLAAPICDQLDGLATDIYTACSFQDLTGQRIQKVIHVMRYLEERIDTMMHIWDDNVSAQAGATSKAEAPTAPTAAAHPAHHDVALDDLDQTDVDMVMDPAQQEAAVKAEPDPGRVTIEHEPLRPAALDAMPDSVAKPERFPPEGLVPDSAPSASAVPDSVAPERVTAAEEPEEIPVFFRAMTPSGPVSGAVSAGDAPTPLVEATPLQAAAEPVAAASPAADLAPTIAAVREALFGAFPGLTALKANETAGTAMPAPVGDNEPAADLYEPAPAVAQQTLLAEPEPETAQVPEPAADDVEERSAPTLVGPADFLLEPLPLPALRALEAVSPFAEGDAEPDTAEIAQTPETAVAEAMPEPLEAVAEVSEPATAIEAIADAPEIEAVGSDTAATEIAAIGSVEVTERPKAAEQDVTAVEAVGIQAVDAIGATSDPAAEILELEDAEVAAIQPLQFEQPTAASEREETVIEAVAAEDVSPAEIETARLETHEKDAPQIEFVGEPPASDEATGWVAAFETELNEAEAAQSETSATTSAPIEFAPAEISEIEIAVIDTADSEIVFIDTTAAEIAEIEAVATAPVAPEAVAEANEPEADEQATVEEPEPVQAQEAAEDETKSEDRPSRTVMPEVTFASMTPVMMPMEATRAEPAGERFAAAATVAPSQEEFIPFGHAAPPRPSAAAAPSVYSTSPYFVPSQNGAGRVPHASAAQATVTPAPVVQADPLAAITALTDDEKFALFS